MRWALRFFGLSRGARFVLLRDTLQADYRLVA